MHTKPIISQRGYTPTTGSSHSSRSRSESSMTYSKNDHHMGTNDRTRSEEHTSELQSPVPISYAVFCLKKKKKKTTKQTTTRTDTQQ